MVIAPFRQGTWQAFTRWRTWASLVRGYLGLDSITTPGQYYLSAYTGGETDALSLAQAAAQSGRGYLGEMKTGGIIYYDLNSRTTPFQTITMSQDLILSTDIAVEQGTGDLVNVASVSYTGGTAIASDSDSVQLYGIWAGTRDTDLLNASDALQQAQGFVMARSGPQYYPTQFTIALHDDNITTPQRINFLTINPITALSFPISSLPNSMNRGQEIKTFVEGWQLRLTRYTAFLTIYQSLQSLTYAALAWFQVADSLAWSSYTPTTQWKDA